LQNVDEEMAYKESLIKAKCDEIYQLTQEKTDMYELH